MKKMMMMAAASACALALCASSAQAGEAADRLAQCLVENASPKDQAALMRWMFSAVAMNPSLKSMTSLTSADREQISRDMGGLFQRLMTQDCRGEVVSALRAEGQAALEKPFEVLGERAAQQLLSDPAAAKELEKMAEHLDPAKWDALMKDGGFDASGKPLR